MTGFYMKCNTGVKWTNSGFSVLLGLRISKLVYFAAATMKSPE